MAKTKSFKQFVHNAKHVLQQGNWSEFESIVFVNLVRVVERGFICAQSKDSSTLTNLFSSLVRYI